MSSSEIDKARSALAKLKPSRAADRQQWLDVGMALHATDRGLLDDWDAWSKKHGGEKYEVGECARQWKGFKAGGGLTIASLIAWAQEDSGGTPPPPSRKLPPPPRRPLPPAPTRPGPNAENVQYKAVVAAAQSSVAKKKTSRWPLAHTYAYSGDFHILRFEPDGGGDKDIRPIHRNGQGWKVGDPAEPLPLYHADEIAAADLIVWCEGEKAVDAARSIGFVATTTSHGAKSAKRSDVSLAAGKEVLILNDADADGRAYAQQIAAMTTALEPPAKVRILELPNLPEHGDVVDFIESRDSVESAVIRAEILALAEATPHWTPPPPEPPSKPVMINLGAVKAKRVEWFWEQRIAFGKVTLFGGDPGLGKSTVTTDIIARASTGTPWPDCPDQRHEPVGSVLMTAEDDIEDTVKPRLDAAGADSYMVTALQAVMKRDSETGAQLKVPVSLNTDLAAIEEAIRCTKNCGLVVIDPVSAYLGETDSHNNAEVRGLLAPLAELAARCRVAVLCVTHLNKGTGPAIYRAMGSLAFAAAARAVWGVMKDKEDPSRRLMLPIKNNLGNDRTGLAYSLRDTGNGCPSVAWEPGAISVTADDALDLEKSGEETYERDEVAKWLRELLAGDPVPAKEIEKQAKACGHSWATVRRAKKIVRAVAIKDGKGAWGWTIPGLVPEKGAQ